MSTTLIERLTAVIETGEVSRSGLARAAGLHPNSLRKLGAPDWNPTADTLVRLEKLLQSGDTEVLVGAEAIINEARNGRMFILVDDDDRENEGDLVIPAQMATPVAIDSANGPDALVSPGHVFPLVARPGGVLVRAGHTEAAVDVSRLAGLNA